MEGRIVLGFVVCLALAALLLTGLVSEADESARIGGIVLDPEGLPVAGAQVMLRPPEGRCRRNYGEHVNGRDVTGRDGRFQLPAPPGPMDVYVRHATYAPSWAKARDDLTVRLRAASWIEGTVSAPAVLTVSRGPWRFAEQQVEGTFRCGPLPPDIVLSLQVTATDRSPYYERIVLQPGEIRSLHVALALGARVTGTVWPHHEGHVVRAHGRDGTEFTDSTDEDGAFTVTGLEPGWVRLVVIRKGQPVQIVDARTGEHVDVRRPR